MLEVTVLPDEAGDSWLGRSQEMLLAALGLRSPSEAQVAVLGRQRGVRDWCPGKGTMVGTHVWEP